MKSNSISTVIPGRGNGCGNDFKLRGAVMIGILDFIGALGTGDIIIGSLTAKRMRDRYFVLNAHRAVLAFCLLVYVGVWGFTECEAAAQEVVGQNTPSGFAENETQNATQHKTKSKTSFKDQFTDNGPVIYNPDDYRSHFVELPMIIGLLFGFLLSKLIIILIRQ